jgi:hypothetical protein
VTDSGLRLSHKSFDIIVYTKSMFFKFRLCGFGGGGAAVL